MLGHAGLLACAASCVCLELLPNSHRARGDLTQQQPSGSNQFCAASGNSTESRRHKQSEAAPHCSGNRAGNPSYLLGHSHASYSFCPLPGPPFPFILPCWLSSATAETGCNLYGLAQLCAPVQLTWGRRRLYRKPEMPDMSWNLLTGSDF